MSREKALARLSEGPHPRECLFDLEQNSTEWIERHRGLLTASDAKKLLTASGSLSASRVDVMARVIAERLGLQEPMSNDFTSDWMERGSELEYEARNWLAFDSDEDIELIGMVIDRHTGASPDGVFFYDEFMIPCEIKCPKASTHIKWRMKGGLPVDHKQQVHFQMALCRSPSAVFLSYHPGTAPLLVHVAADDYTRKMAAAIEEFNQEVTEQLEKLK